MQLFFAKIKSLLIRLTFILLAFVILRNFMLIFNWSMFGDIGFSQWLSINFFGLRFDIAAILATNSLLIILYLIPFRFSYTRWYNWLLSFVFVIVNAINIIANASDIIYIRFTLKRTTAEFISMFTEDTQMLALLPDFLKDFWYISLLVIVLIFLLGLVAKKTYYESNHKPSIINFHWKASLISILIIGTTMVGIRGGFQLRPLSIIDAVNYVETDKTALVLNTPFTIYRTLGKTKVEKQLFFNENEQEKLINPIHNYSSRIGFRPLNVVVIVMESMSKEHSAHFNPAIEGKGFTPFIDSLIPHSLICNYAFANGRKSIEGLPAILASFPTLFNDAFISSNYSANNINSLANTLGKKGYSSAFFHGGNNGTMGFDNFVKSIGFQVYYGRNEYGNEADFDGKWGIFDHQFFPFFLQKLNAMQQPFLASIFSLSAHHPYTIPDEFKGKFPEGIIPIQQCITYSDYALSRFFAEAKTQDWYNNTLFVITADHTSEVAYGDFNNAAGRYAIPIIYFMPGDLLKGEINFTTQQLDIMPSILDYLHFDENFYSLGNSVFAENNYNEAIMYVNQQYQYISNETILHFNTENEPKYIQDSIPNFPFLRSNKKDTLDSQVRLKALVQQYTNDLLDDQMNAEKFLKQKIEE